MKFEIFVFDKVLIESLFDRFWFFFINKTKRIKEEIDQDPFFYFSFWFRCWEREW